MSALPSPLKSPTLTSTQVTAGLHCPHWHVVNIEPLDTPVHQEPPSSQRPVMSALPSPLKSPTCTSTQVAPVLQEAHRLLVNELPVDWATHHWPSSAARPTMSILPSPLKSPTLTSSQVTRVLQVSQRRFLNPPEPLDWATHHWPVSKYRPAMSVKPSPLKSPDCTSTQVGRELQAVAKEFAKLDPFEVPSHQSPVSLTR